MSFNGSGTFLINSSGQPVVTGTTISSTVFNALTADLATGLTNAICKDGQSTTTATIPFATAVTMASTLAVTGAVTLSGNATVGGTLGVTGATTLSSTLAVTGATTLSAALTYGGVTLNNAVTGTGSMVLSASPTLTGTLAAASGTFSGTLGVTGATTLSAALTYGGVTLSNAVTGTGNMVLSASPTLTGTLTAAAINASGNVTGGNLYLGGGGATSGTIGYSDISSALQFYNGSNATPNILTLNTNGANRLQINAAGTVAIAQAATVGGTLGVTGVITASNLTASRGVLTDASKNLISADAPVTNSLSADVTLNNIANYFDGPSVAQGSSGTWFASGTITLSATAATNVFVKLWDGTNLIASCNVGVGTGTAATCVSLSGFLAAPAGNLRISARDSTRTDTKILFNQTGNSKDSTISAVRVA